MISRIIQWGSKFLASRALSLVLIALASGAVWYGVHMITENAILERKLNQANANTEQLNRRLTAEIAISQHTNTLKSKVNNAPEHDGCPEPRILRDTLGRLHDTVGE